MGRISVLILGDQLMKTHPALTAAEQNGDDDLRVVMVESKHRANQYPYHRQKLVLIYSAMRHYAEYLREQGYMVDYIHADDMVSGLQEHIDDWEPERLFTMAASEYGPRQFQQGNLSDKIGVPVEVVPNTQFVLGRYNPNPDPEPGKRYVMENFYRSMRKHFDLLMESEDEPAGGDWNYDKENRKPLPKDIEIPAQPHFAPDEITQQVMEEVAAMEGCVGTVEGFGYAVTHQQAGTALGNFIQHRLEDFGPYEDAMTERDGMLFHAVLSPYFNIGLLEPITAVEAAEKAYREGRAPINSVEGFVRQVIGWREYMYWQYWQQMPEMAEANHWNGTRPMPQMFWDGETDMNCIRHIVERLQHTAYSHHIERLMVISNFCLLAGIQPQAVLHWFMSHYIDAYDWVMQPNVIGMGLNADGGKTATKPYVASANYINKMSDYCKGCSLKHTKRTGEGACPFNYLYWNFLIKNEDELRANPRSGRNVLGLRHLDDDERDLVQEQAQQFLDSLDYYEGE